MENQNLLKKSKKEDKEDNKKQYGQKKNIKFQKKIRFYFFIMLNYLRKYQTAIFICLFFLLIIIFRLYIKKNDSQDIVINEQNNLIINKEKEENSINNEIKINNNIENNDEEDKDNLLSNTEENNVQIENDEIPSEEEEELDKKNLDTNMTKIIEKVNKYITACQEEILLEGIKQSSQNIKITALTASYNSAKTIKATIKSIQNQKMSDIEILIIDDASTDDSLKMIENLQKEDPRIRIIKNVENKGPLYSKSIGALYARGKYIMHLDSDDLFINENIFNICYNEAEKNNIDILEFSGFRSKSKIININRKPRIPLYLRYKENNLYVTQPELSTFIYRRHGNRVIRLIDGFLWGKCIRSEIYRKALDTIGEETYTQKMFYGDDRLVNFVLFRVANSFKYIQEYGIVYYNTPHSILNSSKKIRNCRDELLNIMNIFKFTKDSNDVVFASFEFRIRWKKLIAPGLDEENEKYAQILVKKMLNCKNLSKRNRRRTMFLWKNREIIYE